LVERAEVPRLCFVEVVTRMIRGLVRPAGDPSAAAWDAQTRSRGRMARIAAGSHLCTPRGGPTRLETANADPEGHRSEIAGGASSFTVAQDAETAPSA
jgi:hypothetical protein